MSELRSTISQHARRPEWEPGSRAAAVPAAVAVLALLMIVLTPLRGSAAPAGGGRAPGRTAAGTSAASRLAAPVVGMASTPDSKGYWLAARDGGISTSGTAGFFGSAGGAHLEAPVVGMAATPDGSGYWLTASDGGIFNYGDAHFYGSTGGEHLDQPVVGMAATPDGRGYWLVARDGGIFSYGDAQFYGSTGGRHLDAPVVGMAATPDGHGYWLTASDGGIFNYGDAHFYGSTGSAHLGQPVVAMAAAPDGSGYWLAARNGTTYSYGAVRAAASDCPVGACVAVDATTAVGPASAVGQGFLHSLYPTGQEAQLLSSLGASSWRSSVYGSALDPANTTRWSMAANDGIPTTAIISDMWYTEHGSGATAPWSDWTSYGDWVQSKVQQILLAGYQVGYWEVYNEPDLLGSYYTPQVYQTVTPERLLQQFLVTYQAILAVDPSARVIGPSLAGLGATWSPRTFGMSNFLAFAAAHHIRLAAVSWHENTDRPQAIPADVEQVRRMISEHPDLGTPQIFVNEYATEDVQRIPGWDLSFLAALNAAGVDQANRSCWEGDCTRPVLDGLLAPDGTGTLPDYWLRRAYAQVTGHRVASVSTDASVAALGYFDPAGGRVQILAGRGVGCKQDPRCTSGPPDAPPTAVRVTVRVPWSSGQVRVATTVVPGRSVSAMAQPPTTAALIPVTADPRGGGTAVITIDSFGDGDAVQLVITQP